MNKTKEYEKFKLLKFNRKGLDRRHINQLKDSITKNGYIGNPILVNKDFEILDGQHRFIALKEQGMEVPYEIADIGHESIIDLNITQKRWTLDDYINYYATKEQKPSYQRLLRLCKEHCQSAHTILTMSCRNTGGRMTNRIKDGTLQLSLEDDIRVAKFNEYYNKILQYLRVKNTTRLCAALAELSVRPDFNWKIMLHKAEAYSTLYYSCRTKEEFIVMLKNIYNFNTRNAEKRI